MADETETAQREHLARIGLEPFEVEAVILARGVNQRRVHEYRSFHDGREPVFDVIDRRRPMRGAEVGGR